MTVGELAARLGCRVAAGAPALGRRVTGCYAGDLLSWVMAHARAGDAWITVMGHVNVAAVAVLTGAACVILADGARPDADLLARAREQEIPVLLSGDSAAMLARGIGNAL